MKYLTICLLIGAFCLVGCNGMLSVLYGNDVPRDVLIQYIQEDAFDIGSAMARGKTNAEIRGMVSEAMLTPFNLLDVVWPSALDVSRSEDLILYMALKLLYRRLGFPVIDDTLASMHVDPELYSLARDSYIAGLESRLK